MENRVYGCNFNKAMGREPRILHFMKSEQRQFPCCNLFDIH